MIEVNLIDKNPVCFFQLVSWRVLTVEFCLIGQKAQIYETFLDILCDGRSNAGFFSFQESVVDIQLHKGGHSPSPVGGCLAGVFFQLTGFDPGSSSGGGQYWGEMTGGEGAGIFFALF